MKEHKNNGLTSSAVAAGIRRLLREDDWRWPRIDDGS